MFLATLLFVSCSGQKNNQEYKYEATELNNKAVKLSSQFEIDSAIVLYDQAIAIDETYYIPHTNKCGVYISRKQFDKALVEAEMAIKKKPDLAEGWTMAGMLNEKLGDTANARRCYLKSIELFNKRIESEYDKDILFSNKLNRACSLILLGKTLEGKNELRKLKEENPDYFLIDELLKISKKELISQILNDE